MIHLTKDMTHEGKVCEQIDPLARSFVKEDIDIRTVKKQKALKII